MGGTGAVGDMLRVKGVPYPLEQSRTQHIMTPFSNKTGPVLLLLMLCAGCADHRVPRADDEAMLVYRECMNAMPQRQELNPTHEALANSEVRQSVSAATRSQGEQKSHIECARLAGWDEQ
jgi:hypothetical protein